MKTQRGRLARLNLLPADVRVALYVREADYVRAMRQRRVQPEPWPAPGTAWAQALDLDGARHVVVALGDRAGYDGIATAAMLVHEASHVWEYICAHIAEHRPASEQTAYAVQAISAHLMREYVRLTA